MIFYFTATGNSLYVARQLDSECISIPQVIHGELKFKAERIGIVCPVYGHEMPETVKKFIKKATFDTDYLYLVETYGHRHGGANELAEKGYDYKEILKYFFEGIDIKNVSPLNSHES